MSQLPREARDGLMRAWLEILHEQHPGTTWVPIAQDSNHQATEPKVAADDDQLAGSA